MKHFLAENIAINLLVHNNVRWLSKGKFFAEILVY